MWKIYLRTGLLGGAFFGGMLCPAAAPGAAAVPFFIVLMLGMSFLRSGLRLSGITRLHFAILGCCIALAPAVRWLLHTAGASETVTAAGFYIAITPTAAAAPVIMGMLDGDVEFTAISTVFTNLAVALLFPLMLMGLNGDFRVEIFLTAAGHVAFTVMLPALIALFCTRLKPESSRRFGEKAAKYTFYLWVLNLFLLSSKAGAFLRKSGESMELITQMALLAGVLCTVNFSLGYFLGKKFGMPREGSQALGQKNTVLTIYLAMSCTSPAAALGPVFYIFFHNFWNAIQLCRHEKRLREHPEA